MICRTREVSIMPRDKTATHMKLLECMQSEFLEKGYEAASLNHIAKVAGITSAGVYRHFKSKEDMFISLVQPALDDFKELWEKNVDDICNNIRDKSFIQNYSAYRKNFVLKLLDFIYDKEDNFKGFVLLITCSSGTRFDNFENYLVEMLVGTIKKLVAKLKDIEVQCNEISDDKLHALATVFVSAFSEIIKHQFSKEQAYEYADFIGKLLYPGCKSVLGF